jgi:small subunit ribosomal protein S21
VLSQRKPKQGNTPEEKSNEITAIPELLDAINIDKSARGLTKVCFFGIFDMVISGINSSRETNLRRMVKIMANIVVDESEPLEKAIKRFKRMVEKEGIIREFKKREYYEKPSTILNRKKKAIRRKLLKRSRGRARRQDY